MEYRKSIWRDKKIYNLQTICKLRTYKIFLEKFRAYKKCIKFFLNKKEYTAIKSKIDLIDYKLYENNKKYHNRDLIQLMI